VYRLRSALLFNIKYSGRSISGTEHSYRSIDNGSGHCTVKSILPGQFSPGWCRGVDLSGHNDMGAVVPLPDIYRTSYYLG